MDKEERKYSEIAEILKVLAHPVRLCIVKGLLESGGCTVTRIQSCIGAPQSTISQHMQKLRTAGIIEGTRNGTEICYRLCNEKAAEIIKIFLIIEEK